MQTEGSRSSVVVSSQEKAVVGIVELTPKNPHNMYLFKNADHVFCTVIGGVSFTLNGEFLKSELFFDFGMSGLRAAFGALASFWVYHWSKRFVRYMRKSRRNNKKRIRK